MKKRFSLGLWIVLVVAVTVPATGKKKNIPQFELEFMAQQTVAAAEVALHHAMYDHPVDLELTDKRPGDDPAAIGSRTDDDDRRIELSATNDVPAFVEDVFEQALVGWGVKVEDGAGLVLDGKLLAFQVNEANQAVGATYNSTVRISFDLKDRSGNVLWTGSTFGDATRYGRKFSNDNCNEVLSDALLEALADIVSNSGLHTAWSKN